MTKKTKHLLPLIFLFLVIILFAQISSVHALDFKPQVIDQIGFKDKGIGPNSIGNLIKAIYTYALGIVGILATIVMMYGGVLYITAAGNASKMDNAKQWIFSSLTGLILALSSYTLLYIVNPNLLTMTAIDPIKPDKTGCCNKSDGGCTITTSKNCTNIFEGSYLGASFSCDNAKNECVVITEDSWLIKNNKINTGCCLYNGRRQCTNIAGEQACKDLVGISFSEYKEGTCSYNVCNTN